MEFDVTPLEGGIHRVHLNGRMDSPGVDRIELRYSAAVVASGRDVIVDLSDVSFLASMGIRLFISSARALHGKGAKMVLFGASPDVQSVLDTVALDQIIPIAADQAQALALLKA
ncbi:MAG: anti-sigma factor antagonist [Burkholderiales bacterium]|nr:MAG: anti-sigma factor antagonist [Burkholderiales bacterium]